MMRIVHKPKTAALACAGFAVLMVGASGCDFEPQVRCAAGEVRYTGRPPARLFAYDLSCRPDCFSLGGGCDADCGEVSVIDPMGELASSDRTLRIIDPTSLGEEPHPPADSCSTPDDCDIGDLCVSGTCRATCPGRFCEHGFDCHDTTVNGNEVALCLPAPRALVFSFGFDDLAGGDAPPKWSFLDAGVRQYEADREQGTARFFMRGAVHPLYALDHEEGPVLGQIEGEALAVTPGRLRLDTVSKSRLAGRFFLAWESLTGQPQSQVEGCFDLRVDAEVVGGGVRRLRP